MPVAELTTCDVLASAMLSAEAQGIQEHFLPDDQAVDMLDMGLVASGSKKSLYVLTDRGRAFGKAFVATHPEMFPELVGLIRDQLC